MATDPLSEAIALIKAGKKAEAQKILEPFIEANPQNIPAWMWEADTWPTLAGKIKVLELCLQHNPENQQVKQGLAALKAKLPPEVPQQALPPIFQESKPPQASLEKHVTSPIAVTVSHLKKTYGDVKAVEDVSFEVNEGEIFGMLGPNGAGKTTTIECITGLRHPDGGTISVLGLDPQTDRHALHPVVGVQLQSSTFPDKLKVSEILDMFQSFYWNPANPEELAQALGFGEKLGSDYKALSGGQKQRLAVALALIGQPKIAVLDEMTTGLDPQGRLDTWELIERTRDHGTTVILVTHYMEEAERLCDRVALIDHGRIIALDTPYGLAEKVTGGKQVRFVPSKPFDDRLLTALPEVKALEYQGRHVKVVGSGQLVNAVIQSLAQNGIEALDIQSEGATLEDAFVKLTGRHIHEDIKAQAT